MDIAKESWRKGIVICMLLVSTMFIASHIVKDGNGGIAIITGAPVGMATVDVQAAVQISLPASSVNFGNITTGESRNTTTNSPPPFLLRNDGTVLVNVSIARDSSSPPLFIGTGGGDNSSSFQYRPAVAGEGVSADPSCSLLAWKNVPGAVPEVFICKFNFVDTNDEAEVELLINVPVDEPAGSKAESLVFTAAES